MPSLYAEYLRERTDDEIIEVADGFATYRFLPDGACYIVDIYCRPESRKHGIASSLADSIAAHAVAKGCKELIGSVSLRANGVTDSIKTLFAYGMEVKTAGPDYIIFTKGL
jgi:ribosomal protein S18 acetylase RimI-like enzyme